MSSLIQRLLLFVFTGFLWLVLPSLLSSSELHAQGEGPKKDGESVTQEAKLDERSQEDREVKGEKKLSFILEEIMVTATRTAREAFDTPRSVTTVTEEELERKNPLSVVDSLADRVGIFIEKRTNTTGDPIMRGLAGYNLLTLIDGNTLTTMWGEGGNGADDMYAKIDAGNIERIEVIRGPASVLYGTNALGGVINFITRSSPFGFTEEGHVYGGRTRLTYASAWDEFRFRGEVYGATPTLRYILGASFFDANDVTGGRGLGELKPTGGEGKNWDFKGEFLVGDEQTLELAVQSVHLTHTRRYYRATQDNFNDRVGVALTYRNSLESPIWDSMEWKAYYQYKKDRRRFFDLNWRGEAITKTFASDLQMNSFLGDDHLLTWGLHYEWDIGESPDDEQFTIQDRNLGTVYKDGPDSYWHNLGFFLQDEWELAHNLDLIAGLRYDAFFFRTFVDDEYEANPNFPAGYDPNWDEIRNKKSAPSGGLGLLYHLTQNVNLMASYSRGFRLNAPKFGVVQVADGIQVPGPLLDPTTADNWEWGFKMRYPEWRLVFSNYYTFFRDFQDWSHGTFRGQDWFDWNGDLVRNENEDVIEWTGSRKARLYGFELEGEARLGLFHPSIGPEWSVRGGFTWNLGEDRSSGEPLRWCQPAEAVLTLRYDDPDPKRGFWTELTSRFVRRFDRVSRTRLYGSQGEPNAVPEWRRDPQGSSSDWLRSYGGVPGYTVLDLRAGINVSEKARLILAVENLTDKKHRSAHSRMDAPGINFIASLEVFF